MLLWSATTFSDPLECLWEQSGLRQLYIVSWRTSCGF